MFEKFRLIPVLLLKDRGLYKSVKFNKLSYIGDPINTIKLFNELEVDELIILDINLSKSKQEVDIEYIKNISSEAFMPISYGGGIKNYETARNILDCGIEKLVINNSVIDNFELIKILSKNFGSQSIVYSIDINKNWFGKYFVFDHSKKKNLHSDLIFKIEEAQKNGCGEIVINAVHKDGTMSGIDKDLLDLIKNSFSVPYIYIGGAGSKKDIEYFKLNQISLGIGSMCVYKSKERGVLINYPKI